MAELPTPKHLSMLRGFYLADLFTISNGVCGATAIFQAMKYLTTHDTRHMYLAAALILVALVCDVFDGWIARWRHSASAMGRELDSLADVVSFGIAPAVMAYAWGVRSLPGDGSVAFQQIGEFGWVCCLAFLICCAWRLARFNVQGMAPGSSKYFVGMPTPAAAGMLAALVHGFKEPLHDWRWSVAWFLLAAGLGALMTSTIRYSSFKEIPWTRKQPSLAIVLLCLIVAVIWRYSEYALVVLAGTYTAVGGALHLVRFVRHRLISRTA